MKTTWKKKGGTVIQVSGMTDEHLINAINMVKRAYSRYCNDMALQAYGFSGSTGGEMASYAAEQEGDEWLDEAFNHSRITKVFPQIKPLLDECDRRNLTRPI